MFKNNNYRFKNSDEFDIFLPNLSPQEKLFFQKISKCEYNLFTSFIDSFNTVFIRQPTILKNITDNDINLFGELCYLGINPQTYEKKNKKILQLPESVKIMFEVAANTQNIIPMVRKNMGIEILHFFVLQSKLKVDNLIENGANEYRNAIQSLHKPLPNQKRHIQIDRNTCKIVYDSNTKTSQVFIPYMPNKPLVTVEFADLRYKKWNILVIKENLTEGNILEWSVLFKKSNQKYLITLLDKNRKRKSHDNG